jgi:hypothetical protein
MIRREPGRHEAEKYAQREEDPAPAGDLVRCNPIDRGPRGLGWTQRLDLLFDFDEIPLRPFERQVSRPCLRGAAVASRTIHQTKRLICSSTPSRKIALPRDSRSPPPRPGSDKLDPCLSWSRDWMRLRRRPPWADLGRRNGMTYRHLTPRTNVEVLRLAFAGEERHPLMGAWGGDPIVGIDAASTRERTMTGSRDGISRDRDPRGIESERSRPSPEGATD